MKQFVDVTDVHGSKCSMRAGFAICLVRARIGIASKKSERHERARCALFMYAMRLAELR